MDLCLKTFVCKSSLCILFFCAKVLFSNSKSFLGRRRAEMSWDELSQWPIEMKTVLLRWHGGKDGKRWEGLRWGDIRWEEINWFEMRWRLEFEVQAQSVKCWGWSVQSEVCRKCSLDVALQRGRTLLMFLDSTQQTRLGNFLPNSQFVVLGKKLPDS